MKLTLKDWINKANAEFSDSGWKVLYSVSGRYIYYRRIGRIVFVEGHNLSVTHNTIIAYLPVGYRPSQRTLVPHSFPLNISAYVNITTDGGINPIINGGVQTVSFISTLYFLYRGLLQSTLFRRKGVLLCLA